MALSTSLAAATFAVALLVGGLGIVLAARELPSFWDPCQSWGQGRTAVNGTHSATLHPTPDCPRASGTSETRREAALRLAAVDGTAIVAACLAGSGAWLQRPRRTLLAAALLGAETVLLVLGISIGAIVTLSASLLFLVAGLRWRSKTQAS